MLEIERRAARLTHIAQAVDVQPLHLHEPVVIADSAVRIGSADGLVAVAVLHDELVALPRE